MANVALVWTEASESDEAVLHDIANAEGARALCVSVDALPTTLQTALAQGGVVYVATGPRDANRALGLGADEVVRLAHLSRAAVVRALRRAAVRAEARASRRADETATRDDAAAVLSMLASALGHAMNTPLSIASLTSEALSSGLGPLLAVQERLIGWAALAAPKSELGRLMNTLAEQPSPSELRVMLSDLREGIDRAARVADLLGRLSTEEAHAGRANAATTIEDVHSFLRSHLGDDAALRVVVEGPCIVKVGRPTLVLLLAALLAHAIEAVRAVPAAEARITISVSGHDDAVLFEIAHNGRPCATDLRPSMLQPYFAIASHRSGDLTIEGLQRRARLLGGELLVLQEGTTATLRLALPAAKAELPTKTGLLEQTLRTTNRRAD
jgi:signal transduction histidine kinase